MNVAANGPPTLDAVGMRFYIGDKKAIHRNQVNVNLAKKPEENPEL
jgi:hypothetical protein